MVNHNRDDKLDYCEADNVSISMDITIDLDLVGVILSANSAITKMMMTTITMMTALIEMALLMKMMMQLIKKSLKRCFSKIWRFLYYDFEEEHPVKREDGFAFNILLGSPSHQISQPITLLYHHFSSILVTWKFFFSLATPMMRFSSSMRFSNIFFRTICFLLCFLLILIMLLLLTVIVRSSVVFYARCITMLDFSTLLWRSSLDMHEYIF